jgi:hypothetical protein
MVLFTLCGFSFEKIFVGLILVPIPVDHISYLAARTSRFILYTTHIQNQRDELPLRPLVGGDAPGRR